MDPMHKLQFRLPASWSEVGAEHIGIMVGICVFCLTLLSVLLILVCDGSFARMAQQSEEYKRVGVVAFRSKDPRPELYDELLAAAESLPLKPSWPEKDGEQLGVLEGDLVRLEALDSRNLRKEGEALFAACGGRPYVKHGEYDPLEEIFLHFQEGPFDSADELQASRFLAETEGERIVKVVANRDGMVVGSLRITRHRPRELNVGLQDIWISPGCRRLGYASEALALLFKHFFSLGYRRVDFFLDNENLQGKRWLEQRFFMDADGLLRKYGILRRGNMDVAVYAMTNNQWRDFAAPKVAQRLLGKVRSDVILRRRWEAKLEKQRQKKHEDMFIPKPRETEEAKESKKKR